jgi:protein-L-isoaspartate O-methyltransferase
MNRADFIPEVIWVDEDDGWMVPLSRADDPDRWSSLVNSDDAVVTQADDGNLTGGRGLVATSSSSAPSVMAHMLDMLDVEPGHEVLEIGTGTGYNTALLMERAKSGRVTTIEVDPDIAEQARRTLQITGHPATVITGEGADGYPGHAPYDRVIATASMRTIPRAWLEQSRPDGKIVVPFVAGFKECQAFICLQVSEDGTARGRFRGGAAFMRLRSQRDEPFVRWNKDTHLRESTTRLFPGEPFEEFDAGFVLGLLCPGWRTVRRVTKGVTFIEVSDSASTSGASLAADDPKADDEDFEIIQYGPRNLWDEFTAAYQWWLDAGRPDHTRFGLTVTKSGQNVWLDSPDQVINRG